jgi:hypothetical protein
MYNFVCLFGTFSGKVVNFLVSFVICMGRSLNCRQPVMFALDIPIGNAVKVQYPTEYLLYTTQLQAKEGSYVT